MSHTEVEARAHCDAVSFRRVIVAVMWGSAALAAGLKAADSLEVTVSFDGVPLRRMIEVVVWRSVVPGVDMMDAGLAEFAMAAVGMKV